MDRNKKFRKAVQRLVGARANAECRASPSELKRAMRIALQTSEKIEASDQATCCDRAAYTSTCRVLGWVLGIEPAASQQAAIWRELRECLDAEEMVETWRRAQGPEEPT